MFKRLFFLSGIIAFVLACLTMWFWYLPQQSTEQESIEEEMNQAAVDSVSVQDTTVFAE